MRRAFAVPVLCLLLACGPSEERLYVSLPPMAAEASSALLLIESDPAPRDPIPMGIQAIAKESLLTRPLLLEYNGDPNITLRLALFSQTLEELGLIAGPLQTAGPEGRALPMALAELERKIAGPGESAWAPIDGALFQSVRLPQIDWFACGTQGGCLLREDTSYCHLSCPPVDIPEPPEPPQDSGVGPSILPAAGCASVSAGSALGDTPFLACADRVATATCTAGEVQAPGSVECLRVGPSCPSGDYADDLPGGVPIAYVLAGAAPGGNGSSAQPFNDLQTAVWASNPGTLLAVGKGSYAANVAIDRDLTLLGACPEQTVLLAGRSDQAAVFVSAHATLARLRIAGGGQGVYVVGTGAQADLRELIVERSGGAGVQVDTGSGATLERSVLRGAGDRGLVLQQGAHAQVDWLVVEDNRGVGIAAYDRDARVSGQRVTIRRTQPDSGGTTGIGLLAWNGAELELSELIVERSLRQGIHIGASSTATLSDVLVKDTRGEPGGGSGNGILVELASRLDLRRAWVLHSRTAGVQLVSASSAYLADVSIDDVLPIRAGGQAGDGVAVSMLSQLTAERLSIRRSHTNGIWMADPGTVVRLNDLHISEVRANDQGAGGKGISNQSAALFVTRAIISDTTREGIVSEGMGGSCELMDVTLSRTGAEALSALGIDDVINLSRGRIDGSDGVGALLTVRTEMTLSDLEVSNVRGTYGIYIGAITAKNETALRLSRFYLHDNVAAGLDFTPTLGREPESVITNGAITNNMIGIHFRGEPVVYARSFEHILLSDNVLAFGILGQ